MKNKWKMTAVVVGLIVYMVLLVIISSAQSDYNVKLSTEAETFEFVSNEEKEYSIPVKVNNKSNRVLSSAEEYQIFLSYHLYDGNGNLLVHDGMRSSFEHQILSHETDIVDMHMNLEPGEYIVEIDVLQEFVAWFAEHEDTAVKVKVIVK